MQETCMCWGFECEDGWYNLLDVLCASIQNHVDRTKNIEQVVAVQVKEKFGTLRFYYHGGDDYVDAIVNFAENLSGRTCEVCGAPGSVNDDGGWLRSRCDKHKEK